MDLSKRPDQRYAHTTMRRVGRCISSYLGMLVVGFSCFVPLSLDQAMAQFPVPLVKSGIYRSCKEILTRIPSATSGVYSIRPDYTATTSVYCNMTYDGGGWTLIASSNGTGNTGPVVTSLTSTTAAGVLSSTFVQPLANLVTRWPLLKVQCRMDLCSAQPRPIL